MIKDTRLVEITRRVMVAIEERWTCPIAGCFGEMKFTGEGMTQLRTNYQHQCDRCHKLEWLEGKSFPRIVYEPATADEA